MLNNNNSLTQYDHSNNIAYDIFGDWLIYLCKCLNYLEIIIKIACEIRVKFISLCLRGDDMWVYFYFKEYIINYFLVYFIILYINRNIIVSD